MSTNLWAFECRASDDDVKTDLELIHFTCGRRLCDVEAGDELAVLVNMAEEHVCRRVTAHFQPQAWVNENAVDVDAEGDQTWDCTEFTAQYLDYVDGLRDGVDVDDIFKDDPAAPDWVTEWQGPFTITIKADS